MTVRAISIQPGDMSAEDLRLALSAFFYPDDVLTAKTGFLPGSVPTIELAGGLAITVPAFRAAIQGSSSSDQGVYVVANDGDVTVTLDAGGTNDRIDLIVAQIRNDAYDSSGEDDVRITFVKGTEGAAPVAPDLPVSSLKLGEQRVQAGASASSPLTSANLTTVAGPVIAGLGGIRPVSSTLGGVSDDGLYAGQYRDNDGDLQRWDGDSWDTDGIQTRLSDLETDKPKTGSATATTTSSGRISFDHSAPFRPTRGYCWVNTGNNYLFREVSHSSTTSTFQAIAAATGLAASADQDVTVGYVVYP